MSKRVNHLIVLSLLLGSLPLMARNVSDAYLRALIHSYFAQRFAVPDSAIKLTFNRLPDLTRFANKDIRLQCHSQNRRLKLGLQTVWLHILQNGRLLVKVPVSVQVQVQKNVIVTTDNIPFRSPIGANCLRLEKRWISRTEIWEQGIKDLQQVVGLESAHFIPAGKVLLQRDVREADVIHPGDEVEIRVPAGSLVVTAKGIARSAGKIGQYIYVKNTSTGKRLRALVESANVVVVAKKGTL